MKFATASLAIAGLLISSGAMAGPEATITGISDYDFRGVSQSGDDPALQVDANVSGETGWYVGLWGSNVDFDNCCDEDFELDWYAGFTAGETVEWDFGVVYYSYPGASDDLNYTEVFLGGTYAGADDKWDFGIKQWYSWEWFGYDDDIVDKDDEVPGVVKYYVDRAGGNLPRLFITNPEASTMDGRVMYEGEMKKTAKELIELLKEHGG